MRKITCFIFSLFLLSCNNQRISYSLENVPILIDFNAIEDVQVQLRNIRYIPLETTDESLIGAPYKVLIRNERIYVGDFTSAQALFVFNMEGEFLFRIARRGQGPGEYRSFTDFDVRDNGDIYIFDVFGRQFLIFDSMGQFLRDIRVDYFMQSFSLVGNKMYQSVLWGRGSGDHFANLATFDLATRRTTPLIADEISLLNLRFRLWMFNFFRSGNNRIFYAPQLSPIIYSIDENGVHPAIGIKNLPMPPRGVIDRWVQDGWMDVRDNYFTGIAGIYETCDYIVFSIAMGLRRKNVLFNKHTKSAYEVFDYFSKIGSASPHGSTGREFFSAIVFDPYNATHADILNSREELRNWREDDNPVIAIFNLDM